MSIANVGLPLALNVPFCALGNLAPGSTGYLEIQTGSSNPALPFTPDQMWSIQCDGTAGAADKGALVIRGQSAGPSPAVDAISIAPVTGAVTFAAPIAAAGLPLSGPRACGLIHNDGTTATVASSGAYNIATASRISGGTVALTWTNAMPDTNYAVLATLNSQITDNTVVAQVYGKSVSGCTVVTTVGNNKQGIDEDFAIVAFWFGA
jgi:hypothetical protein